MSKVFVNKKIDLDKIRISLAAAVGRKVFQDSFIHSGEVEGRLESFEKIMRQDLNVTISR